MAQQTAVEWLIRNVNENIPPMYIPKEVVEQAKAMEKEQIMKAFSYGQETPINHPTLPHYSREEYYNDTYSKRQDSPDTDDIK